MDSHSSKSNKIREIVRLQQLLKKWRKRASSSKHTATAATATTTVSNGGSKSIKFLKRTLSLSETSGGRGDVVPKGCLAVSVGDEQRRFVIPMEYLGHKAFEILLREAEEEFGFQQTGVLTFPCEVAVFERAVKMVEEKRETKGRSSSLVGECRFGVEDFVGFCESPHAQGHSCQSPLCR